MKDIFYVALQFRQTFKSFLSCNASQLLLNAIILETIVEDTLVIYKG